MRTLAAVVLAALVAVVLAACGAAQPPPAPVPPREGTVRLAAVGDSITAADGDLSRGVLGRSWLATAARDGVVFAGGWARWGAPTADMAAAAAPVDADVLVVLAGTNDVALGVPFRRTAADLRRVVARVGVPRVVLSAVPPRDDAPELSVELNARLRRLAAQEDWTFADPMRRVRDGDRFAPGMTEDGLHPSPAAAVRIGEELRAAVLRAAAA